MNQQSWAAPLYAAMVLALGLTVSVAPAADAPKQPAKEAPGREVYGITKVWQFHLTIPANEYQTMQPPGGGMGFPAMGLPGKPAGKPFVGPLRDSDRSAFGTEFPWAEGAFTVGDTTFQKVGFRYKGNSTYMSAARGLKRSLKVELDHYDDALRFQGLKTLNLHCGVLDGTKGREALAYSVFRAAGVPAPRTAFAEVTLTVPGKYDKELLGLYIVVEQVDKLFLQENFKTTKGLLMKPERIRGLDYLGEDWQRYETTYQPKGKPSDKEIRRVIDFTKLVNQGTDEQFRKQIGSYLDVDAFLRFMAGNALVVNLDSFFTLGHNYYLYLHPETNQFHFIPWDLDLSLANFAFMGSPDQLMDLSIAKPYGNANKLPDRLLAIPEVSDKYQKILKELVAKAFVKERLLQDVDAIEAATKSILVKEAKAVAARKEPSTGFSLVPTGGGQSPDLRKFVEKRTELVAAQLDGKSKGFVPTGGFGPGGGGGKPGGGFGIGGFLSKQLLGALDADKDSKVTQEELTAGIKAFFKDADKDNKGKLDDKTLTEGLVRLLPPPGFGPKPDGAKPDGAKPAFRGVGPMFVPAILQRADTDKNSLLTLAELVAGAEALFKECDKDKNSWLDDKELAAAIDLLFPGFGRPGDKPPERKPDPKEDKKP